MAKKMILSVALAVYNEQETLPKCLDSVVGWADEIVIVDGGSTDATVRIAKSYGASVITTDNPAIFHINKQKALDACQGEWILQLDADEVVEQALKEEISKLIASRPQENGFFIPRKNYFGRHWLRKGGQYPDHVIRLLRQGKGHFPSVTVHEQIAIDGKIGHLTNHLLHYTYPTISDYWRKSDAYTALTAERMMQEGVKDGAQTAVKYLLLLPIATFFSLYIRHKGLLDGYYGFIFALFSSLHFPIAYKKFHTLLRKR